MDHAMTWGERYWPDGLDLYAINQLIWEAATERIRTPPPPITTACLDGTAAERSRERRELAERLATVHDLAGRRRAHGRTHGPEAA